MQLFSKGNMGGFGGRLDFMTRMAFQKNNMIMIIWLSIMLGSLFDMNGKALS